MRLYSKQHQFYAGIDLHSRQMYICIISQTGDVLFHKNMDSSPENLYSALEPYLPDVVVGVECVFTWYWIADFCENNNITFILGHALYMKAIHGGKTKNDKIDSSKIASLIKGGLFPLAYVYPHKMRAARDLLRRRQFFVHHQSELQAHIRNTNSQYNLTPFTKSLQHSSNRDGVLGHFPDDDCVRLSISSDLQLLDFYHQIIISIEYKIKKQATHHDPYAYQLLRTIPGIGPILALTIIYEIHDINRFENVGRFISYSRLVKCSHESAGKRQKGGHNKIGNSHLRWAFSEAAAGSLRNNPPAKKMHQRLISRYGKAKAMSLMAQKIGRCVFFMLKRKEPFDALKFYG